MNETIIIGFTGTRLGMSREQQRVFQLLMQGRAKQYKIARFVHGGAIGADEQADAVAAELRIPITVRPGSGPDSRYMIWVNKGDDALRVTYPGKPPLERNRLIVDSVNEMFATPAEMTEKLRSGTWATIRYTQKCDKKLTIIYPDGSLGQ